MGQLTETAPSVKRSRGNFGKKLEDKQPIDTGYWKGSGVLSFRTFPSIFENKDVMEIATLILQISFQILMKTAALHDL